MKSSIVVEINQQASNLYVYLFKEVILILGFLYLFLFNGTSADFVNQPILKVTFIILTVVGLLWLLAGQHAPTPLARPILIFVIVYFLASLISIDPRRSLEDFGWLIFIVFLFGLSADLVAHRWPAELLIKSLIVSGGLVIAFVWVGPIQWYLRWLQVVPGEWIPSAIYRMPSANVLAMFLNTYLMIVLARIIGSKSLINRFIFSVLLFATLGLLYLTSSRAGWIGTGAGLCMLILMLWHGKLINHRPVWNWLRERPVIFATGSFVLLLLLICIGWLLYRQTQHPTHGPLLVARKLFWRPAITAFLEHPILGQGPYTFNAALLKDQKLPTWENYVHAHSTPLNLLAETGLLGGMSGLFLAFATVRILLKRWLEMNVRQNGLNRSSIVLLGACASLSAYSVHGLGDAFQAEPIGLWFLALVLGTCLGQPPEKDQLSHPWCFRPWWVIGLLIAAWYNFWLMEPLYNGVYAAYQGAWPNAVEQFELATRRDPNSAVAWQQLGFAQSILAEQGNDEALEKAIVAFNKAVTINPEWALHYANLGALYQVRNDLANARANLEQAANRAQDVALYHLGLGKVAEMMGDYSTAEKEYVSALDLGPWSRIGPFWNETTTRIRVKNQWDSIRQMNAKERYELQFLSSLPDARSSDLLDLAQYYFDNDEIEKCEQQLRKAELIMPPSGWDYFRLLELKIQVAERTGAVSIAQQLKQKRNVEFGWLGFHGPGQMDSQYYSLLAFRKPAYFQEVVFQNFWFPWSTVLK